MRAKTKIQLEEYVHFHEKPQKHDLTIHHLNQIITMHGFIKLHNRPKKDLLDALNSIGPLLSPQRSTLEESISCCASLELEQVKEDLAALEWQECPIQSIQTVKLVEEDQKAADSQFIRPCSTSGRYSTAPAFAKTVRKKRSHKRKREVIQTHTNGHPLSADNANALPSLGSW